jgi:hypothetical protein
MDKVLPDGHTFPHLFHPITIAIGPPVNVQEELKKLKQKFPKDEEKIRHHLAAFLREQMVRLKDQYAEQHDAFAKKYEK